MINFVETSMEEIVNKVAQSGLITIDLESYYDDAPRVVFDIKEHLFMGLMLKEKEFREFIKSNDWSVYKDRYVSIVCSSDAIVPTWAYMLITSKLEGICKFCVYGNLDLLEFRFFKNVIDALDLESYRDKRIVVKGCSNKPVPISAYAYLTEKLTPLAKSIMYGEPCSTVPIFKKA
jgi:hypothetical protein